MVGGFLPWLPSQALRPRQSTVARQSTTKRRSCWVKAVLLKAVWLKAVKTAGIRAEAISRYQYLFVGVSLSGRTGSSGLSVAPRNLALNAAEVLRLN